MGSCTGYTSSNSTRLSFDRELSKCTAIKVMTEEEIHLLHLMYLDLASRISDNKINLENFLLFFHKNGFWGESLFREFDQSETQLLSEEQFVCGMSKILKASEKQKIALLFKLFAHGEEGEKGIGFHNFLRMLYNYPKDDLRQVLNEKEFIEYELRNHLVPMISQESSEKDSLYYSLQSTTSVRQHLSTTSLDGRLTRSYSARATPHKMFDDKFPSIIGRQVARALQSKNGKSQSVIKLDYEDHVLNIKAINIQQLAKCFAQKIFKQANIDIKTGKLNFDQFYQWISKHKALYKNYYRSFHNQIWEMGLGSFKFSSFSQSCQKFSEAEIVVSDKVIKVRLFLQNSILVACKAGDLDHPIILICLQGLAVRRIFQEQLGFGIDISHRDGYYSDKRFFFKNEALLMEWLNVLQFYKRSELKNKYEIVENIGSGRFSTVYRCICLEDHQQYALKEIALFKLDAEMRNHISHQTSVMQVVSHPLLLEFKEHIQTKTHMYIITELVKGDDLLTFVKKRGKLKEQEAAKLCEQIIVGVRVLHSYDIVHRDLKPQNIMVAVDKETQNAQNVKIIDFGLSIYISKLQTSKEERSHIVGTPNYIAPEVLREEPFDFKIDNFAIGVILYFMLTGELPFFSTQISQVLQKIMIGDFTFPEKAYLSKEAKNLISLLLKNDPKQRISLQLALEHDWFNCLAPSSETSLFHKDSQ